MSDYKYFSQFQWLIRDIQQFQAVRRIRAERTQVIDTALLLVNRRHRTFQSLGFDHEFIFNELSSEIEPYLYGGPEPTPQALANAWANRFQLKHKTQCELARRVLPMMSDFVYLLEKAAAPSALPIWVRNQSLQGDWVLQV